MDPTYPLYIALGLALMAGFLSFFSPCVLGILPVYIGYLSGNTAQATQVSRGRLVLNTFFFVLGIGVTFLLLGFAATTLGALFNAQKTLLSRIGGILIILFGLAQLGFLSTKALSSEKHLPFDFQKWSMNPAVAFLLGLFFSFAWTPCVGPILTSILVVAGNAATQFEGILLIGIYTMGMAVPFLLIAWLAEQLLPWIKAHAKASVGAAKISGVLMLGVGVAMTLGLLSQPVSNTAQIQQSSQESESAQSESRDTAVDFTLKDSEGKTWKLSDLKGKTVVLNFWATWCHYCVQEIPDLNEVYRHYKENEEDVIVLGIASPDGTPEEITKALRDHGGEYPSLVDTDGRLLQEYGIQAFPMTYIIDKDGKIAHVVRGATNSAGLFAEIGKASK